MEQELTSKKKEVVDYLLKKGVLISSELINQLNDESKIQTLYSEIQTSSTGALVINEDTQKLTTSQINNINWTEVEKSKVMLEKGKYSVYNKLVDLIFTEKITHAEGESKSPLKTPVKILFSYEEIPKKRDIRDFIDYFNNRHRQIASLLRNRIELGKISSINKILNKKEKETVSIIAMVADKQYTKNNNLIITLEDPTGQIKAIINKTKKNIYTSAKELVMDEVVGGVGVAQGDVIFVNNIIWPDIPVNNEMKKSLEEGYIAFLSDLHVGSSKFLPDDFDKFIKWINCEVGNDSQRKIAEKIKYLFIAGDLVDGCGVYPDQEKELLIPDIYEQYKECARLLSKIPKHIPLIICPGNHDALRIAEPQPKLGMNFSKPLHDLPNAIFVSNPALVNVAEADDFTGFNILMYHGYSFDYFVSEVDSLRANGGYNRGDLIMKFLMKRRHLAPSHTSTLYIPETKKD